MAKIMESCNGTNCPLASKCYRTQGSNEDKTFNIAIVSFEDNCLTNNQFEKFWLNKVFTDTKYTREELINQVKVPLSIVL